MCQKSHTKKMRCHPKKSLFFFCMTFCWFRRPGEPPRVRKEQYIKKLTVFCFDVCHLFVYVCHLFVYCSTVVPPCVKRATVRAIHKKIRKRQKSYTQKNSSFDVFFVYSSFDRAIRIALLTYFFVYSSYTKKYERDARVYGQRRTCVWTENCVRK